MRRLLRGRVRSGAAKGERDGCRLAAVLALVGKVARGRVRALVRDRGFGDRGEEGALRLGEAAGRVQAHPGARLGGGQLPVWAR